MNWQEAKILAAQYQETGTEPMTTIAVVTEVQLRNGLILPVRFVLQKWVLLEEGPGGELWEECVMTRKLGTARFFSLLKACGIDNPVEELPNVEALVGYRFEYANKGINDYFRRLVPKTELA